MHPNQLNIPLQAYNIGIVPRYIEQCIIYYYLVCYLLLNCMRILHREYLLYCDTAEVHLRSYPQERLSLCSLYLPLATWNSEGPANHTVAR